MMVPTWTAFAVCLALFVYQAIANPIELPGFLGGKKDEMKPIETWATLPKPDNFVLGTQIETPESPTDKKIKIFRQPVLGENQRFKWPFPGVEPLPLPEFNERPVYTDGKYKVHYVFPSTKHREKNDPLRDWAEPQIKNFLRKDLGINPKDYNFAGNFANTSIKVKQTGVGEQPWTLKMGFRGAWNRTRACAETIKPDADKYHMIWILAIESCVTAKEGGYDSPNMIAHEVFSGYTLSVAGAGPAIQDGQKKGQYNLVQLALDFGYKDGDPLQGNMTYGDELAKNFGLNGKNWHEDVCGHSREALIKNLLGGLKIDFQKVCGSKWLRCICQ